VSFQLPLFTVCDSSSLAPPMASSVTPSQLQTNQLRQLERQLEEENTLLTANYNQLKMAQQKFTDAAAVVSTLTADKKGASPCGPALALGCPAFL
jgi:hypothetical protein